MLQQEGATQVKMKDLAADFRHKGTTSERMLINDKVGMGHNIAIIMDKFFFMACFLHSSLLQLIQRWKRVRSWKKAYNFITERCAFLALIFGSFPNDSITVMTESFLSYFLGLSVSFFASTACFLSSSNNSLDLGSFFSSSRY